MDAKCIDCDKGFSNMSNLRAHARKMHPDKVDLLCPKKQYEYIVRCNECHKGFVNKPNLKSHCIEKHGGMGYFFERLDHRAQILNCTLCEYCDNDKNNLLDHYKGVHAINIITEKLEFLSCYEFDCWKKYIEKQTLCSFVKMHGTYRSLNYTRTTYTCHRSGKIRQRGTGQRNWKKQGSKKLNGYCPASMRVVVDCGRIKVKYIRTHVGHKQDLEHLFLTYAERKELASKIVQEVSFDSILEEKCDAESSYRLERMHFLNRQDLHNIKRFFHINKNICEPFADLDIIDIVEQMYEVEEKGEILDDTDESSSISEECKTDACGMVCRKKKIENEFLKYLDSAKQDDLALFENINTAIAQVLEASEREARLNSEES